MMLLICKQKLLVLAGLVLFNKDKTIDSTGVVSSGCTHNHAEVI